MTSQLGSIEKKCARCGVVKPVDDFWRRTDRTSGRRSVCIRCVSKAPTRYGCGHPYTDGGLRAPQYCPDCIPACDVDDCDSPSEVRGWCLLHYHSWRKHGDPLASPRRYYNQGQCRVDWCDRKAQDNWHCKAHASQIRLKGQVEPRPICVICGIDIYAGKFPRRHDASFCRKCRWRHWIGVRVSELLTDGLPLCGICGCDVDLDESGYARMGPHIDHVIPRSRGGSDDISNLQLSHAQCNRMKKGKASFSLLPVT